MMHDTGQPILVDDDDEKVRRIVRCILAELDLPAQLTVSWRDALVSTNGPPACIIADLDDVGENAGGVAVLRKGCGGTVPLVVLSKKPDVYERVAQLGAVAGLRKPPNVEALMLTVRQLVPLPD
jgi:FixJ family two-component response regulator